MASQIVVPSRGKSGKKVRKAKATKTSKKIELAVRQDLLNLVEQLNLDVRLYEATILYGSPTEVNRASKVLQDKWRELYGNRSDEFANTWARAVDNRNKDEFQKNVARAFGVDYTAIFDDRLVRDTAQNMAVEASKLISDLPEEYLSNIQDAVMRNYQQIPFPEGRSLTEEIQHVYDMTRTRAKLIARDQTSKMNIAITQARNEELGITEYIWRTANDSRVVGTPGGLFPEGNKVHGNHYERNGKTFKWADPPSDGHPGYAINCRCYAEPIIDLDRLNYV